MRLAIPLFLILASQAATAVGEDAAIERAVGYLAREVPGWHRENKCFSCHNNGDAARALLVARQQGHKLDSAVLADTLDWLAHPERWNDNGGEGEFNDRKLARIQFTSALALAVQSGALAEKSPLVKAAAPLIEDQRDDGHWHVVEPGTVGAPATYGNVLATSRVVAALQVADARRFRAAIEKGLAWLRQCRIRTTPDAAGVLLALADDESAAGARQRRAAIAFLKSGQSRDGGWGPYTNSPPETFDTAVAVLALSALPTEKARIAQIKRGRDYLSAQQNAQGNWTETTRPSGSQSYAQHMSTTGWATLALLGEGK